MQIPLQITFHGVDHSDAVEERIREKAARLEAIFDRIISCRVVVELHHKNNIKDHAKGQPFHVTLDVKVPGQELVVKRDPKDAHAHEDVFVALRDAFQAMERQLKDYVQRMRVDVKSQAELKAQALEA